MARPAKNSGSDDNLGNMDISPALQGWQYRPDRHNVRLIRGRDGKPKIQVRLDLGLLQMEVNGRPDGKRPHKSPTELHYHLQRLAEYRKAHRSDSGFMLTSAECEALREESSMFYHRYLSFFVMEEYSGVVRDTQHNLSVLDLCRAHGETPRDRSMLEEFRPYIIMMQGRALACDAIAKGFARTAMAYLRGALRRIFKAYALRGEEARRHARHSKEAQVLLDMLRQLRRQLPPDPRIKIRRQIKYAVAHEKYEQAAVLRDQLMALDTASAGKPMVRPARKKARASAPVAVRRRGSKPTGPSNGDSASG